MNEETPTTESTIVDESIDGQVLETQVAPIDVGAEIQKVRQELSSAFMETVREKEARNKELEGLLKQKIESDKLRDAPVLDDDAFLSKPNEVLKHFSRIVEESSARQIAPLQEAVDLLMGNEKYTNVTSQFKASNPNVAPLLDLYGPEVKQIALANGKKASDLTVRDIRNAVIMIPGLIMTGQLENRATVNGNPAPMNEKATLTTPNIRPSSPPVPKGQDIPSKGSISDSERLVMKHMGIKNDAEFIALRDAPPDVRTWPKKIEEA